MARDEHLHPLAPSLAVGAVGQDSRTASGEKPFRIVGHGSVGTLTAERASGARFSDDDPAAEPFRIAVRDNCRHRHGHIGANVRDEGLEFGKRLSGEHFDEHVERSAAGEPDGERIVVRYPVSGEHRSTGTHDVLREFVDRAFDAAARDRTGHRTVGTDDHGRSDRTRRGIEGANHRRDRCHVAGLPGAQRVVEDVVHSTSFDLGSERFRNHRFPAATIAQPMPARSAYTERYTRQPCSSGSARTCQPP